jgi:CRISPR-associated protein Csd2
MTEIKYRYDFVFLFDVQDGNPNGDPDAGNLPRVDPETGHGLVTDVCLKRKIRNYVQLSKKNEPPFEIYVKEKAILNKQHERGHAAVGSDISKRDSKSKNDNEARDWMCGNFFDVRTFGAVMSTGNWRCGQVRGPVQLTFARSIDPVIPLEYSITRMAVTTEKEALDQGGDNRTMGRKFTVPYGLYKCYGFVSANLANQTQFSEEDLKLLWEALLNMFDHDRSASHGLMQARGLFVFKHDSEFGRAPAHRLFDLIKICQKVPDKVTRSFEDYEVVVDKPNIPEGIELIQLHESRVAITV